MTARRLDHLIGFSQRLGLLGGKLRIQRQLHAVDLDMRRDSLLLFPSAGGQRRRQEQDRQQQHTFFHAKSPFRLMRFYPRFSSSTAATS